MRALSQLNLDTASPAQLEEALTCLRLLTEYASYKRTANTLRSIGAVLKAKQAEQHLEAIYRELPVAWRWREDAEAA